MLIFYQNENNTSVYYDFLDDSKDQTTEDYLSQYGTNFTDLSRRGLLEQCFSRENEVYQIMETLVRKQKNNPVLIGEPGVGKTAIVELFADRIANKDVPFIFYDYEIIGIDITKMIGGSKFRGEFELRLNGIIEEILKENNIIVFLDELHILKGAGTTEGAIDAGNILKPALSRPGFRCLGASTPKEYKKIEEDAALNRRFQPIIILEPSKAETFEILDGMRTSLEIYHNVEYTDSSLIEAINLSAKYIGDKTLPDKAVDLLDRAGSREVLFHTDINHVSIFDAILSNGIKKLSLLKLNAFRKGDIPTQFVLSEIEKAYKNLLLRWGQEQKNEKDVLIEKENFLTKFDSNAIEQDFDLLTIDTISYKKKNNQIAKNLSINLITKEIQYENFLNFFFLKNLKITNKAKKFLLKNFDNFLNQEKTNFLALLKKSIFNNEKKIVNNLLNIKKISRIIEPNIFLLFDFYKTILENLNFKIERKKKKLPLSLKTYNQKNLNHKTLFLKVNNYIYKIPQKNKKYLDIFNVLNTQENDSNKINLTKINKYKNTYRLIKNIIKPFSLQTKQSSFLKIISNAKNVNKKKNPFYLKTLSLAIENILIEKQLKRKEANIYKYSSIDNNVISLINTSIIQRVDDLLFFSNKPKFILDNKENIKNLSKKKNTENYKNLLDNFYNLKNNKNKQIKINQLKIKLLNPNSLISLYRIGLISLYKEIYEVGNLLSPIDRFIKEFYIIKWKTFYTFFSKYLYNYSNNLKEFNKIFFEFSSKKKNNTREYFVNDIVLDFIDDDIQKTSILQKHLDDDNKIKIDILKDFFKLLPPLLHKKYIDVLTEESLSKKEQETFEKKDTSISFFQKEEENAILYNLLGFLSTEKGKNFLSNTNDPQLLRIARKIGNYKSLGLEYRVSSYQIQRLITNLTGIPVESLTANEMKKLINLENLLHKRIIGQNEAIATVSKAIRRSRLGIQNPNRPIGSFLFCGPTGVGKTELSKALTEAIFGSEKEMIRFDMSEFMERFSVTRLIGSPPGYVGYEEGGQLSDSVRKKPYSLVLFDEIEKAHIEVLNILLQILEDGRLTDSQKRLVSFENTIIIMTSNAAAKEIQLSLEMLEKKPNGKKDFSSDKTKLKRGLSEKTKNNTKKLKFFKKLGKNLYGDPRLGKISLISNKINTNFTVDIRDNIKQNFSNSYSSNFYINKLYSAFPEIKAFNIKKEKNKKLTILKNSEKLQSENQIENSLNQKIKGIKKTLLTNNSDQVDIKELVMNKLTKFFLPEFINRLDDIIVFESLTYEDIIKIYDVMVEKLIKRVRGNRINLIIDPSVKGKLVNEGYSKTFGARPLRRLVTKYLEDTLSNSLLNFQGIDMTKLSKQGCKVRISLSENDLIVGELII